MNTNEDEWTELAIDKFLRLAKEEKLKDTTYEEACDLVHYNLLSFSDLKNILEMAD